MKWLRLLTWILLVSFVSACSVHVGPSDSTHRHSKNKHKKHKKKKHKHKKKHKKVHKKKNKAKADNDAPPPPSNNKIADKVRGNIPAWVLESDSGGKDNTVKPSKSKSKSASKDVNAAKPRATKPSGALRMAHVKTGQTTTVTYDLKAGDCTGYVVQGDRGIKDLAAVLTEGRGRRMRIIAKDDPDGNEAVLNRGGCIDIGNKKKSVTLHVLIEKGKGKVFIQRFRR